MFHSEIALQDSNTARPSNVIRSIAKLGASAKFTRMRVAMAYATYTGCTSLISRLSGNVRGWKKMKKRWLVSIDFGRSEVSGIRYLQNLPNSEVRIPGASELLARHLIPQQCFHPKTYILDVPESGSVSPFGIFVGSGNLTTSGLHAGVEHGIALLWSGSLPRAERTSLLDVKSELHWWDEVWELAEIPTQALLKRYARMRPRRPQEDRTSAVRSFVSKVKREVEIDPGLSWTKAKHFWIQTLKLYENRGKGVPGNQLDTKRGTRVYFGFSPNSVSPNTVLGNVTLQYDGKSPNVRSVRFGDNSMDKVNLPIPGTEGPNSYDYTVVHFERIGPKTFRVSVGSKKIARIWWKKSKAQGMLSALAGGREFGFYN